MTTQIGSIKTPFSISDILTDLKVNPSADPQDRSDGTERMLRFANHTDAGVKQLIYGINRVATDEGYASAAAARKRMDEKRGGFVRRGSLECFLIDNKNQSGAYPSDRRDSYYSDQYQKPLDMRRSVASSLSDAYDSGEESN